MKIMWFTLWREPTGVAAGVGVGVGPEVRPSPAQPVRRNSNREAGTHASNTLLQRVIWAYLARWRFAVAATTTDSSSSLHSSSDEFFLIRVG
jgi:hypothetical protein